MKVLNLNQRNDEWLDFRRGKISGSKVKNLIVKRGTNQKIGFYQLIAEQIAQDSDEFPIEHGINNEPAALEAFSKKQRMKLLTDEVWQSDENPNLMVSPDGSNKNRTVAVEVKCPNSATHIKLIITKDISDYLDQIIQYFIVNENLKRVWLVSYDPRVISKPYFEIPIDREDLQREIEEYKRQEEEILEKVKYWVERLSF